MGRTIETKHVDVLVVGGGSAGVAAALGARKNGAETLLVEAGPAVGGELISGLPILGRLDARGERIVSGVIDELLEACQPLNGYAGDACDYRLTWATCVDGDVMRLAIQELLARYGVQVLVNTFADDVVVDGSSVEGVVVMNKSGRTLVTADVVVDCSGDGVVAIQAGADYNEGGDAGEFQPISLIFQMGDVDFDSYLSFVRDKPEEFLLAENPVYPDDKAECARRVHDAGPPFFTGLSADGQLLGAAIESGDMFPTTAMYTSTSNLPAREVTLNATRVADLDPTSPVDISDALATLADQVGQCIRFLSDEIPGFETAHLTGISPRVGVRETRRVVGEYVLTSDDVIAGRSFETAIASGGHHIDIHGSGTDQTRIPVEGGGSYDIPYECLIPVNLENVLLAGRCLSADREAFGSARVIGQCVATGQSAGAAAAWYADHGASDVRDVPASRIRDRRR
jgi:hypothetical protein